MPAFSVHIQAHMNAYIHKEIHTQHKLGHHTQEQLNGNFDRDGAIYSPKLIPYMYVVMCVKAKCVRTYYTTGNMTADIATKRTTSTNACLENGGILPPHRENRPPHAAIRNPTMNPCAC